MHSTTPRAKELKSIFKKSLSPKHNWILSSLSSSFSVVDFVCKLAGWMCEEVRTRPSYPLSSVLFCVFFLVLFLYPFIFVWVLFGLSFPAHPLSSSFSQNIFVFLARPFSASFRSISRHTDKRYRYTLAHLHTDHYPFSFSCFFRLFLFLCLG